MNDAALSGLDGWNKSRFEAYAKLLLLKNGRQIEDASDLTEIVGEETGFIGLDGTESVNVEILSGFREDELKRAFLDRLSELVANEKGGHHVSASLMVEWPDRVDVLVARNTGLKRKASIVEMLETVASNLRDISRLDRRDPAAIDIVQRLWTSLVQSYKPRTTFYLAEARQAFRKTALHDHEGMASDLHGCQSSLLLHLENFRVLVNDLSRLSTQDGLEEAVQRAYDICHSYNEHDFETVVGKASNVRTLRTSLGFLGRLKTCLKTFIRAAERLSNFQGLRIIPVTITPNARTKSKMRNPADKWSVANTFSCLDLSLDDQNVRSIFKTGKKKPSSKRDLLKKFDELKSPHEVHAEVQVLLAATRHDCTGASTFSYVGCSKRSCFLCSRLVQRYGQFSTRGCHGKLYDLWTVPDVPWFVDGERLSLIKVLEDVENDLKDALLDRKAKKISLAQESTIGGSSVATVRQHFDNPYTMSLVSRHLEAQRGEPALDFEGKNNSEGSNDHFLREDGYDTTSNLLPPEQRPDQDQGITKTSKLERDECHVCGRETYRHCAHCNRDWFCSQKCQDRMSLNHLAKCSARPITTADILFDDVLKDQLPKDEETCEAFGFNRCSDFMDKSHLLGLYRGLLLILDPEIGPVKLHEWQRKVVLARKIVEKFSARPDNKRGSYFPWFLRHQYILDKSTPSPQLQGQENPLLRAIDAARPFLEPEDHHKGPRQLEPIEKRYCFLFYALALDGANPNPNWVELDLWYDFGFALCTDEHHEGTLGGLYSKLVSGRNSPRDYERSLGIDSGRPHSSPTCSFGEFWRAWTNGSIPQLFEEYGLGDELDWCARSYLEYKIGVPYFREFMSVPVERHQLRPSVWRLKHLLSLDDNTPLKGFPEIEAAAQEYGFTPRLDARTRMDLRQFYIQLFKAGDPLEINRAKERGKLLEYAQGLFTLTEDRVRDLLQKMDSTAVMAEGGNDRE